MAKSGKVQSIINNGITWLDIQDPTEKEIADLAGQYRFHPLDVADFLSESHLPKLDAHDNYLFLLIHLPVNTEENGRVNSSQVSIFLGRTYLLTIHNAEYQPITEIFHELKEQAASNPLIAESSAHLLYRILSRLVDQIFPMLDNVMKKLDQVEDGVFDQRVSVARELSILRREIADFRRIVLPLRRLIGDLPARTLQYSAGDVTGYFGDVKDHLEKAWEILDEMNETIVIYKDADYVLSSERANTILAVLTILFTLTIPSTVIGTLYGMNVPLPGGLVTGPWTFLGTYTTFIVILLGSLIPSIIMVWYFRRMGWF